MAEIPYRHMRLTEAAALLPYSASTVRKVLSARQTGKWDSRTLRANDSVPHFKRAGRRWVIWGPSLAAWIDQRERRTITDATSYIPRATRTPATRTGTVGAIFALGYVV